MGEPSRIDNMLATHPRQAPLFGLALLPIASGFSGSASLAFAKGRLPLAAQCRSLSRGISESLTCKTIAVVGATGGVGLETVYQALSSGFKVRALCRTPEKLVVPPGSGGESKAGSSITSPDLEIIQGDVTKAQDVEKLLNDDDIQGVVVALGGRTADVGKTMLTDGTKNVITSMKSKGLSRVAIVTSIGAGDSYDQAPFAFKLFMWTILKDAFVDKNA